MKKRNRIIPLCMVTVMATMLFSTTALAATSKTDQMAANSAAWHIANAAGDKATCDKLHAENQKLATQVAGSGGSSSYNSSSGTWSISDSKGNTTKSSSSSNGKSTTNSYTTTSKSGSTKTSSSSSYTKSSIDAYKSNGGTDSGLTTAYNNDAYGVSTSGAYGDTVAVTTAENEAAVAQELLGLTNAQTKQLQSDLEKSKQLFENAQTAYETAVKNGDTAAAETAQKAMDDAHDAAESTRAKYNYSGDSTDYDDGGYYDGTGKKPTSGSYGGGFYVSNMTQTFNITASTGQGGSVSPVGVQRIEKGQDKTFTVTPNYGFIIDKVLVDGTNKGAITSYTFDNVTAHHTISATFKAQTYNITASAGNGGTVSPSGVQQINMGTDKTVTITPKPGFKIDKVLVDGANKGAVTSYTFDNVTTHHTISATFVATGKVKVNSVKVTDLEGNNLANTNIKSGYGIFVSLNATETDVTDVVVSAKYNFGEGVKTTTLANVGYSYQLAVNSKSPHDYRCVYIPVEAKDKDYTITFTITGTNAADEIVTDTKTATITVLGSMYEDDFTSDGY